MTLPFPQCASTCGQAQTLPFLENSKNDRVFKGDKFQVYRDGIRIVLEKKILVNIGVHEDVQPAPGVLHLAVVEIPEAPVLHGQGSVAPPVEEFSSPKAIWMCPSLF
jgi:hypothetical protein